MKMAFKVIGVITILFIAFQIYTCIATGKSETQLYKLIKVEKDYEIRFYPSSTMAVIKSSAKTYRELGNNGFRQLAGYIFGGNDEKMQIAMTSPVHMDINDTISRMSFVMPASYNVYNLPQPNNSDVTIETTADEYVAAITFGGFATQAVIERKTTALENALKENKLTYFGHFRVLGYNPPYQIFGRKNEIIVAVLWDNK